jgi:hypothetical protein
MNCIKLMGKKIFIISNYNIYKIKSNEKDIRKREVEDIKSP